MSWFLFHFFDSFRTKFLYFSCHWFDELEIKDSIDNSSFSFPLISFTKRYAFTYRSLDSANHNLSLGIGVEMMVRMKVLNEISMYEIKGYLIHRVTHNNIRRWANGFPEFECITFLSSFDQSLNKRKTKRSKRYCMHFISHFRNIFDITIIKFLRLDHTSVGE